MPQEMGLALELLAALIAGRQALSLHCDGTIVVGDAAGLRELMLILMWGRVGAGKRRGVRVPVQLQARLG